MEPAFSPQVGFRPWTWAVGAGKVIPAKAGNEKGN